MYHNKTYNLLKLFYALSKSVDKQNEWFFGIRCFSLLIYILKYATTSIDCEVYKIQRNSNGKIVLTTTRAAT